MHHDALRPERHGQATQRYRRLIKDIEPAFPNPGRKDDSKIREREASSRRLRGNTIVLSCVGKV